MVVWEVEKTSCVGFKVLTKSAVSLAVYEQKVQSL